MTADNLRALAQRATPGPWKHYLADGIVNLTDGGQGFPLDGGPYPDSKTVVSGHREIEDGAPIFPNGDGEYIAAANPSVILELCREMDDLKAKLEAAERARGSLRLELDATDHARLANNQYLIDQRDAAIQRAELWEKTSNGFSVAMMEAEAKVEKLREALRNVHACATYDPARDDCMGCPVRDVLAATAPATTTEPTT